MSPVPVMNSQNTFGTECTGERVSYNAAVQTFCAASEGSVPTTPSGVIVWMIGWSIGWGGSIKSLAKVAYVGPGDSGSPATTTVAGSRGSEKASSPSCT